jgi:hypothetical protein
MTIRKTLLIVCCLLFATRTGTPCLAQIDGDSAVPAPTLAIPAEMGALDEPSEVVEYQKDLSCSSAGWMPTDCCLCPSVYGFAEALFLERDNQSVNQPVVITGLWPDAFTTELSTGDLNFGWESGLRALMGVRLNECTGWAVEGSYLGVFNADAAALAVRPDANTALTLPGGLGPALNVFQAADQIRLDYGSELHSADLSLVRCRSGAAGCGSVEWMAGFRYLDLSETFGISGLRVNQGLPETGVYNVQTHNNLYGAQLGARLRRCLGRLSGEVTGKAGIYYNDASQAQFILDYGDIDPRRDGQAEGDHTAFVGEVNLSAIYQLTSVWGLRAGYNLIWIEGVALAPDQLDFSSATDVNQLSSSGGLFLHGVNVGLEARW